MRRKPGNPLLISFLALTVLIAGCAGTSNQPPQPAEAVGPETVGIEATVESITIDNKSSFERRNGTLTERVHRPNDTAILEIEAVSDEADADHVGIESGDTVQIALQYSARPAKITVSTTNERSASATNRSVVSSEHRKDIIKHQNGFFIFDSPVEGSDATTRTLPGLKTGNVIRTNATFFPTEATPTVGTYTIVDNVTETNNVR